MLLSFFLTLHYAIQSENNLFTIIEFLESEAKVNDKRYDFETYFNKDDVLPRTAKIYYRNYKILSGHFHRDIAASCRRKFDFFGTPTNVFLYASNSNADRIVAEFAKALHAGFGENMDSKQCALLEQKIAGFAINEIRNKRAVSLIDLKNQFRFRPALSKIVQKCIEFFD